MAAKARANTRKAGRAKRRAPGGSDFDSNGFWERIPVRTRHLTILGILVVASAAFFAPATFEGKSLIGSDTLQGVAMAKSMDDYKAKTGENALWATNVFSGMPGYLIRYPKVAVQLDVIAVWSREHLWPTVQFLILLAGVYVLVYYLTGNTLAGLIAALGAGFTTYIPIILAVGHATKFMAISYVPWLLAAMIYTLRNPRLISAGIFAVLLAVELRAGHPQITYYAAWLFGILWVVEGVEAIRNRNSRRFVTSTAILALGTVLAILMVAQPYWSQLEYKRFSTRGGAAIASGGESTGLGWDYAMSWSQGRSELLTFLVAGLYGEGGNTYWGAKPFTAGPHYLGGVILLLALIAIIGRREPIVRGLTIGSLVLTLFSLGKNASWLNHPLFDHFPLFNAFRTPEMWLHMVEFSLAVLAAMGAAYLVDRVDGRNRKRNVIISICCVLGLSIVLTLGGDAMFSFEREGEAAFAARQLAARQNLAPSNPAVQQAVATYLRNAKANRSNSFKRDSIRTTLILLLASALIWLYFRGKVQPWALLSALALLVLFDLWGVGKRHLSDASYRDGEVGEQIQEYGFDRYILDRINEEGGPGHFRALSLESSPVNWARPAYFYETSGGYHPAKLQVYQDFIENVFFDQVTGMPTPLGLDLSGTRFVVSNRALPGMRPVYSDPTGWSVLERTNGRPRTGFVGRFSVVSDFEDTYSELKREGFDPNREAVVASDPGIEQAPIDTSSTVEVRLVSYGPRDIEWDVETDAARLLVTSEVFYPAGWKAFVDDAEVPILQTNHTFRGVVVPAGTHVVRMDFNPRSDRLSSWIAVVATVVVYGWLLLFAAFALLRRARQHD